MKRSISYKPKNCVLCERIYNPTTGSQKACPECVPEYFKFCVKRWNASHQDRNKELNRALYAKYRQDPEWVKRQQQRKNRSVALRKSLDPVYKRETWKRNKDREYLKMLLVKQYAKCNYCGSGWPLECDHIDDNPFNHNLSNLHWLCVPCHLKKHGRIKFS